MYICIYIYIYTHIIIIIIIINSLSPLGFPPAGQTVAEDLLR